MQADSQLRAVAVIVNWNGLELLQAALPSILRQSIPFSRIVVVDNASHDGSLEYLESLSNVDTVRLLSNRGFAHAANLGIVQALEHQNAGLVALINNDVTIDHDWLERATAALDQQPEVAGCATCLLRTENPKRIDTAGIDWDEDGWADNHLHSEPALPGSAPVESVFGVSAAAGLFRRELFERVGLFDESFFAYQEDVDLALRARSAGCTFALAPAARGRHLGHASNRPFPIAGTWADFFNARNRLAVLAKSAPADQWRRSWRRMVTRQLAAVVRSVPEGRWAAVVAGTAHGIWRLPSSLRARSRPPAYQLQHVAHSSAAS